MRSARLRLDELLLARATVGLEAAETTELEGLLAAHPNVDADAYERAAAVVCLATLDTSTALPPRLWAKVERQAEQFLASGRGAHGRREH